MKKQIVLSMTLTALAAFAETRPPCPTPLANRGQGQKHSSEPILISDGSIKLSFYSDEVKTGESPDSLIVYAGPANAGSFVFANGVDPSKGSIKTGTGTHAAMNIDKYEYEVEVQVKNTWKKYSTIVFSKNGAYWAISPCGPNPLHLFLKKHLVPITTGAFKAHNLTEYEYRMGDLHLRIGSVSMTGDQGTQTYRLATGCSAYRIEPTDHPLHAKPMPAPEHPCPTKRALGRKIYPPVVIGGKFKGMDVSADLK